tara:strand:- start:3006 stop:3305 length:300 start_codon:yes stop_codon:yes gene_type:complete
MSEEEKMPAETAVPAEAAPALGVNDLKLMANIIEVVSNRGAIKANEMAACGALYNNLMNFLVANGAVENTQPDENTQPETPQAQDDGDMGELPGEESND